MPSATATIVSYVRALRYEALPEAVSQKAKAIILDALGCQLACSQLQVGQIATEFARRQTGRPESTVVGAGFKTGVEHAALVNGVLGHGDEIDETLPLFGHASAVLVPALLAVGEREGAAGEDVIVAITAGYEVAARLARAGFNNRSLVDRNFHQASSAGSVAAAAAAGRLIGLGQKDMQSAVGLAAEQACGLQAMRLESGHMNKSLHTGIGSRNGVTAAYLAQAGYGGVFDVLDPPHSIFEAFAPDNSRPEELIDGLGQSYAILESGFKLYASGRPTHSAIAVLLAIMSEHEISAPDIETIRVSVPSISHRLLSGSPTLNINIEYVVAVAALDGQVGWEQYSEERRADPELLNLQARVTSRGSTRLDAIQQSNRSYPAHVVLETRDGRTFEGEMMFPPGDSRNPLTPAELETKFRYWSTRVISMEQADRVVAMARRLEMLTDMNELGDLVRSAGGPVPTL